MRNILIRVLLAFMLVSLLSELSCGRRGDPVAIEPYGEVAVVQDLTTFTRNSREYLRWGMPVGDDFPAEALKGFVVFRAELEAGETADSCECDFRSLDLVRSDSNNTFEYLDKKALAGKAYVYKVAVMDKNNRMGKDSNLVTVGIAIVKQRTPETVSPGAPSGLTAVYTQKSVVLTWDEISAPEIQLYRLYRSEGADYTVIGETVTPAFTDKNAAPSKKYYYKVTAVASGTEGPPSKEIEITTEIR